MMIRQEKPGDIPEIRSVIAAAFADVVLSSQTEPAIVDALRSAASLDLSLVAEENGVLVGHVAFSPVTISGRKLGWYGLGPVSVKPDFQGTGIGQALIREGLTILEARGAKGCVVLGEPNYYARFGFAQVPELTLPDVPSESFQALSFAGDVPRGTVAYHAAFGAS